ncbi:hypothetical protein DUI87_08421 [Hirundo rustica rustica]|uniref:Uncharacterized protein n=1 Tax=Hirundo rustica rustica TaxID=333673 RepID=A0A3M0LAD0_HIRRU|nr:hypothetical protein DUI87_08421 [Hirundo rustica rustica]
MDLLETVKKRATTMIRGGLEDLPQRQNERAGAVRPGKEKAPGTPHSTFQYLKGLQESGKAAFHIDMQHQDKGKWLQTDKV